MLDGLCGHPKTHSTLMVFSNAQHKLASLSVNVSVPVPPTLGSAQVSTSSAPSSDAEWQEQHAQANQHSPRLKDGSPAGRSQLKAVAAEELQL